MITADNKKRILEAIAANRANYPSDAKHAASLGISTSVYSAIKNGQTDKALSDANWITIARRLGVNLRGGMEWKAAKTATFDFITIQLEACQQSGLSAILCDIPNIGKDIHCTLLCAGPPQRNLCGLLTGEDKAEAGA